jgi:GNAT superfamily N-acetyltransferase
MITIREATADDAAAVAAAHVAAWRTGYRGVFPDDHLDSDEFERSRHDRWEQRLRDGPPDNGNVLNTILVPELDGRVVGFGHVGDEDVDGGDPSGRGEVYGFYLHPDAWGSGTATVLMTACETAIAAHFERAVLWTLFDTPRSRRFYEKAGWSCGRGDELLTSSWTLTDHPVTVVQYRRVLR